MSQNKEETRRVKTLERQQLDLGRLVKAETAGLNTVGISERRTDDLLKVTGKLKYASDYPQQEFLHGKILRSPYPHALIKSIEVSQARELPGVVCVLTGSDLPGRNGFGAILADQPVICQDKVRFIGDGVALVAAESERIAQKALELIQVEYEELPAIFDPRDALADGAPQIHDSGNKISRDLPLGLSRSKTLRARNTRLSGSMPSISAAFWLRDWRTWAQARIMALPIRVVERLPTVGPDSGTRSVSGMTRRTSSNSTPEASAQIWGSTVKAPWPISVMPE